MINIMIRRSDGGEISVYDRRDQFMASFRNGEWINDRVFEDWELEKFTILEDESEIASVLAEARTALNKPLAIQ